MEEIWKDVPGYEGYYQASTMGRVRSLDRETPYKDRTRKVKGKILKSSEQKDGRLSVMLSKDNKQKRYTTAVLIALTFIGERPKGYDVLHANGNSQDNRLINLSYDTRSQNTIDHYRYGSKNPSGKLSIDEVLKIRRLYSANNCFVWEIANEFNISTSQVIRIGNLKSYFYINDDGSIEDSDSQIKYG